MKATKLLNFDKESIIFVLYGTDSIDLAEKVRTKLIKEITRGIHTAIPDKIEIITLIHSTTSILFSLIVQL